MAGVSEPCDVVVIGGGVAGLTVALELADAGRRVRVLEAGDFEHGTSHGNAGLLCPSYVTPIASPGVLLAALGWLVRGHGPFTLARAPWRGDMAPWLARFLVACARQNGPRAIEVLARLARESIEWYDAFAGKGPDFGFRRRGWMYVYVTSEGLAAGVRHAEAMARAHVHAQVLSAEAAAAMEGALRNPAGAIWYPGDAHLDPHAFIASAVRRCKSVAVELSPATAVRGITRQGNGVRISTDQADIRASDVVIAAGWETPSLARMLGASLPVLPARGHSVTLCSAPRPAMPLLLSEAHLVVTPMPGHVRMTTGLELGASTAQPDATVAAAMARDAGRFLRDEAPAYADAWVGFRPLTPDGLPIVGRLASCRNVIVTSGYGTLGMTLAPAAARIVRSVLEGGQEPRLVSPSRFHA